MNGRMVKFVAGVIHRACSPETQAMLVDNLLCCDAMPNLSDHDVRIGEALFDALVSLDADLPNKAMSLESYPSFHQDAPTTAKSRRISFRGHTFEVDLEIAHAMETAGIGFAYISTAIGPNGERLTVTVPVNEKD
jgi:hypothetical protein